jgi:hypothetical protein
MIVTLPKLGPVKFRDDLTQEQFLSQVDQLSKKHGFRMPGPEYGLMESFTKGVSRGVSRLGSTFGDVIPAIGASALGFDDYAQRQMAEAKASQEELARTNPAQFDSYKQVEGVGDAARFALETLGETTPDILAAIGSGGVGSAIAKRGATKLAERELAAITPGLVETGASAQELAQVTGRVGAEALAKRQAQGQGIGVYLGSYALNTPEVFQSIYQDSNQLAPGAALLFGSVSAALDSVLPATVLRSMSPAFKAKVTEKVLQQSGMRPGLAKNIATGALKGVSTEALTESAQEAINIAAEGFVNQNRDMWTSDDFNRIVESGVRGAVAGGAFGAVGGVGRNAQQKATQQEIQQREEDARMAEEQRLADIEQQKQQAIALQEEQALRRSQANMPMGLPGIEEAVGPVLSQTEPQAAPEVVPEGQQDLFGATGRPTPEALASVRAGPIAAARAEKDANVAQKQAIEELAPKSFDIMQNVRMQDSGLGVSSPLQSLINQAQEFGPKVKPAKVAEPVKVKEEVPAEEATTKTINDNLLKSLGIGPTARIRKNKILEGRDPNKPEDLTEIRNVLEAYLDNKNLSGAIAEKVDAFLGTLPPAQATATIEPTQTTATVEPTIAPVKTEQQIKEEIKLTPPLSADAMTDTSAGRVSKEDVPAIASEFITSQIRDSVKTDLDTEGVPSRAEGRADLEQLETATIQKNINKKALLNDVVEPIRAVNILREVLDLRGATEKPTKKTKARVAELEKVIAGFKGDLPSVYQQLQSASPAQVNNFFDSVNAQTKETLDGLIADAREKVYPRSKTKRVLIPEDTNKNNVYDIVDIRKRELGIKESKEVTFQEAAQKLLSEIDKFIGKAGRAYFVEETPPEILKALGQLIEVLVRDGIRSVKDATARIRQEFGNNVFRTIKKTDIAKLFNEELKKQNVKSATKEKVTPTNSPLIEQANEIGTVDSVLDSLPEPKDTLLNSAANALSNVPDGLRKGAFGFLSLPNMVELFGNNFPTLKNLLVAVEKRGARNVEYRDEVSRVVREGSQIVKSLSPEMVKKFNNITLDLTRLKLDPRADKDKNHPVVKQFYALPEPVYKYALKLADKYKEYGDKYLELMINAIPQKAGREYLTLVEKMKAQFESNRIPFYLPLQRSGEYWVSFQDKNGERVVLARESQREAEQLVDAISKLGGTNIQRYSKLSQITRRSVPPTGFMAEVVRDLNTAGVSDEVINGIYQSYLSLFPAESLKQQFRPREGILGYDNDVVQGFANIGSRMAHQLANMEYSTDIGNALKGVREVFEANPTMYNRDIMENITAQEEFLANPVAAPWAARTSYFSYLSFITGNVSSAVVNLTQLPIVVYSMLGGKYGFGEAASAMSRATKMYFAGSKDNNSEFMPDWTFGLKAKGEYAELYKQAVDRSALRRGVGYDLTEMGKSRTKDYTGIRSKIEHGLGFMFQNSERFNREVTLIAAFDLARKSGKSVQEAIDEAIKLNTDSHSHALADAGPRWFQNNFGKVMFTFKRFAQAQIYLTSRLAYQAFAGESPEVRRVAQKQLTGIFGMAYLFAGAQGMPLYGAANLLVSALNAALGDDDELFDFDESVREAIGDMGYKGPVNQILNVDIAGRTGFNGMVFRDDPRRLAEVGPLVYAIERFAGPAYSVFIVNPSRAMDQLKKGQVERSIETMMPSFIRNGMKGVRFATEGALNSKGVPIVDDVNDYNALMQVLGFTPADLSEAYARAGVMKEADKFTDNRKKALLDALYLARTNGDFEGLADINEKIAAFNIVHPEPGTRITRDTIKRSKTTRENALKNSVDGVYINPKRKDYLVENYGS